MVGNIKPCVSTSVQKTVQADKTSNNCGNNQAADKENNACGTSSAQDKENPCAGQISKDQEGNTGCVPNNGTAQDTKTEAPYQRPYIEGLDNPGGTTGSKDVTGVSNGTAGNINAGTVRAVNGKLYDSSGKPVVLKGYNIWKAENATLDTANMNAIRFNMNDWQGADRDHQKFIDSVKAYAQAHPDKTVILGYRSKNMAASINQERMLSQEQLKEGVEFWQKASAALKDTPNVMFNLENELGLKPERNEELFGYYKQLIPAARSAGAKNPILISDNYFGNGAVNGQPGDFLMDYGQKLKALDPEQNIVGSIHPYAADNYDTLARVVTDIKQKGGIPVVADEFGDHAHANTPEIVQRAAQNGVLDGLLFWGGADLTGPEDTKNFKNNWQNFVNSLGNIQGKGDTIAAMKTGASANKTTSANDAEPATLTAAAAKSPFQINNGNASAVGNTTQTQSTDEMMQQLIAIIVSILQKHYS